MRKKKQIYFILVCLLILLTSVLGFYYYKSNQEAYNKIHLTFKETEEFYEVNTTLEAITFIKGTNAYEIDYPIIDTSKVGEKTFIYKASDKSGHTREFVLLLNIVDTIKPVLTLTQTEVSTYEGEALDFKTFIKEAYDPVDGTLEVSIDIPSNINKPGKHEVTFTTTDKNNNTSSAILNVSVKEKSLPEVDNPSTQNKPVNEENNANKAGGGSDRSNQSSTEPPIKKTANEKFLFSNGYDMNSATNTCVGKLANAKKAGYGGGCFPIKNSQGLYIGMELILD